MRPKHAILSSTCNIGSSACHMPALRCLKQMIGQNKDAGLFQNKTLARLC